MTKSELIERIAERQRHLHLSVVDVELAVKTILDTMSATLVRGQRIEVRGFGSFAVHHRVARRGRNPRTGEPVQLRARRLPRFRPGKELRRRVDAGRQGDGTPDGANDRVG